MTNPNVIPTRSRELVARRQAGRCFRCGGTATEWHHRRSRSVRDDHRHCPCNGVLLCKTCHDWVHAHPFEARAAGLIVSRHEGRPGTVAAICIWLPTAGMLLTCSGGFEVVEEEDDDERAE